MQRTVYQIRASNADIDNISDWFACVTFPLFLNDTVGELSHMLEDSFDARHHLQKCSQEYHFQPLLV